MALLSKLYTTIKYFIPFADVMGKRPVWSEEMVPVGL
jgi:hypothetical protein